MFETTVSKLTANPENVEKAKPLYIYFHKYESNYGELVQIRKLELRMAELFPEDPKLLRFSERYSSDTFSPADYQPVISSSQVQPKPVVMQSIESVPSPANQYVNP